MSELTYKTGEEPRKGDMVKMPSWACQGGPVRVTTVGETCILVCRHDGEKRQDPAECALLRRAGEAEDRDREKYQYHEDVPPDFYVGWEMIVKEPPMVFRRLRQPDAPATPAKPPFDPAFAPPGFVAKPRLPGGPCKGCHFEGSLECPHKPPNCIAQDRPDGQEAVFVPKFEAVVWPVERDASGICYAKMVCGNSEILAYVGNGFGGFTIAGFFPDQVSAETFAERFRMEGKALCGHWEVPVISGNPAKFCVATRSNDETRS